jgi:hypothetical protein
MPATGQNTAEAVHRLLFRALLEMREQGRLSGDKAVFHLADLFHTVVLEMARAADGKISYQEVLKVLEERAKEKGLARWLEANLAALHQ